MDNIKKAYKALRLKDAFEALQTPVLAGDLVAIVMAVATADSSAVIATVVMSALYSALWGAETWCSHRLSRLGFSEVELERMGLE